MNRKTMLSMLACALGAAAFAPAHAQEAFPSRPITLVIPFPAGGATDVLGRLIGKKLGDKLGQSVVIDNRAGAGTVIGASYVAKAAPDGYTLLLSSGTTFTVNPAVRPRLPYDPVKSFDPIGITGRTGLILLASKSVPVNDVKQFVSAVKAAPDKYSYGSFGAGTTSQFAGEMFFHAAGLKIQHVPYKGSAGVVNAMLAGDIDLTFDSISTSMPHIRGGRMHALAVTSPQRSALVPEVPTVQEQGIAGFDVTGWYALIAPAGTPPEITQRLSREIAAALRQPQLQSQLAAGGYEPVGSTPEALQAHIEREITRWAAVVKSTGARVD